MCTTLGRTEGSFTRSSKTSSALETFDSMSALQEQHQWTPQSDTPLLFLDSELPSEYIDAQEAEKPPQRLVDADTREAAWY